jgi:hypothetical protein
MIMAGTTALHFAVVQGHGEAVRALAECGANITARFSASLSGVTPLQYCVRAGKHQMAMVLRQLERARTQKAAATEVEAADYQGARPVHWAKNAGQYGAVEALRKLGADVNAPNPTSFLIADMLICSTVLLLLLIAFMSPSAVSSKAPHAHSRRRPGSVPSRRLGRTWRRRERRPLRRRCGSLYPRLTLHSKACSWVVSDAAFLFRG